MTFLNASHAPGHVVVSKLFYQKKVLGGRTKHWRDAITHGLKTALLTLCQILQSAPPRNLEWADHSLNVAVLYADAFFKQGDRRFQDQLEAGSAGRAPDFGNGWGFVARLQAKVVYAAGHIEHFCNRKAFNYFFEIYAQLVMVATLAHELPSHWFS